MLDAICRCNATFHTSLYSIAKLWLTLLAPMAPVGLADRIFSVVYEGAVARLLTVLIRKKEDSRQDSEGRCRQPDWCRFPNQLEARFGEYGECSTLVQHGVTTARS